MKDDESLKKLGNKCREIRLKLNLTQEEAASLCNLDRNYVGMLERGERNPSYLSLLKFSKGLNVPLSKIVDI